MYARLTPIEKYIIKLLPKKTYFQPFSHFFLFWPAPQDAKNIARIFNIF